MILENEQILLKKKNNTYYMIHSESNLIANGNTVELAYQNLLDKRSELDQLHKDLELFEGTHPETGPRKKEPRVVPLSYFLIFSVSLTCIFIISTFRIGSTVSKTANRIESKLESTFSVKNLTKEQKEKKAAKFREKMQEIRPYIKEIKKAWDEN